MIFYLEISPIIFVCIHFMEFFLNNTLISFRDWVKHARIDSNEKREDRSYDG